MSKQSESTPTPPATEASVSTREGSRTSGWKSMALASLVVLNAALLLSLTGRFIAPNTAEAASAQAARPSEYLMLPARPIGLNQDVVYILDTDNGALTAVAYNQSNRNMDFIAPLRLAELFQRGAR